MGKIRTGKRFGGAPQDVLRHDGVPFLGDELGGFVRRQAIDEEEVGDGQNIAQQL